MQAPRLEVQAIPPPPGIIGSLRAGFDAIASHITVILMPLALDLLLWLGPRFSMDRLAQPVLQQLGTLAANSGAQTDTVQAGLDVYRQFFSEFNLLVILRTFPIGVFSLMSGRLPAQTPLGNPAVLQVDSAVVLLGLLVVLTVAGWLLGGLYFRWVAGLVITEAPNTGPAIVQTLLYSTIWAVLTWTLGPPLLFVMVLLFSINSLLGEAALLILAFMSLWLIVPVFFSPHGIFVKKQNAVASFIGGFQMTRFTLPATSLFVLTVVLIGIGMNVLWSVPTVDSWLALVGFLGHAFITTALLASSFVYYHDMTAWLQTVLERLRAGMPAQRAQ